jgi:exodeoxyribonuclease VII large subunit
VKHQIIFNKTLSINSIALKLEHLRRNLGYSTIRLDQIFKQYFETQERKLINLSQMLEAYSFKKTLDRGFALVRSEDRNVISSAKDILKFRSVCVMFKDGEVKFNAEQ